MQPCIARRRPVATTSPVTTSIVAGMKTLLRCLCFSLAGGIGVAAASHGATAGLAAGAVDWPLPPTASAAQPDLSPAPDGSLLLTWIEKRGEGHLLRYARHAGTDPATGWSTPRTITAGDDWFVNWADFPALQALPDGSLWAHVLVRNGAATYAYDTKLFVSRDGGKRWTALGAVHDDGTPTEHGFATLWPQSRDTLGIAWLDGRHTGGGHDHGDHGEGAGAMSLRAAVYGADGKRGESEIDVSTCDCCQTASAATGDGTLLAWRDRAEGEVRDIVVARYDGKQWSPPVPVHADGWVMPACPVNGPAIATREAHAWVAWYTAPTGVPEIRIAASADGGRSFGPATTIARGDAQQGRVDVAADGAGVWVSWVEETAAGQSLWLARYSPDLAHEQSRLKVAGIAGRGRGTGFPRLQVRDGAAWLAWTEVVDGAPRLKGAVVRP